jgi:hypothetical protein
MALDPLYYLVHDDLIYGSKLQFDEKPEQVMNQEVKDRTATGRWSVYTRSGSEVIVDFQKGRGRDRPD